MLNIFKRRRKSAKSAPMEPTNVLIISSSAKDLWEINELVSSKYESNIDSPLRLDNGDFAIVVKRK